MDTNERNCGEKEQQHAVGCLEPRMDANERKWENGVVAWYVLLYICTGRCVEWAGFGVMEGGGVLGRRGKFLAGQGLGRRGIFLRREGMLPTGGSQVERSVYLGSVKRLVVGGWGGRRLDGLDE
jgi:hypothetical protein